MASAKAQRQRLMDLLKSRVLVLQFVKVTTGSNRFMLATLNPMYYMGYDFAGGTGPRAPGLIVVWDVGKRAWRSFYIYNLEQYSILI